MCIRDSSYTDKSLDQLLPTPAERADQLITNITSHFSLLENTAGPISEETIAKLKQTFSESFLDQLLKTTGEKKANDASPPVTQVNRRDDD